MKAAIGISGLLIGAMLFLTGCTTTTVAPVVVTSTSTITVASPLITITSPVIFILTTTTSTTVTVTVTQPTTPPPTLPTTPTPTKTTIQNSILDFVCPVILSSTEYLTIYEPMLNEIMQYSEGSIRFNVFTSGSIVPRSYQYEAICSGDIDMGVTYFGDVADDFPLFEAFTFPAAYDMNNIGEDLIQALGDRIVYAAPDNTKVLCYFFQQPYYLYTSNKQVITLEDIRGLKINTNGTLQTKVLTALGAVPISLSKAEILTAAERNLIDGSLATPGMVDTYGLTGVFKYALGLPLGYNVGMINLNANIWTSLPNNIKTVFEQAAFRARYDFVQQYINDNAKVNGILVSTGGAVYNLPTVEKNRWINTFKPVVNQWVADEESKGLPATELLDDIREECWNSGIMFPY